MPMTELVIAMSNDAYVVISNPDSAIDTATHHDVVGNSRNQMACRMPAHIGELPSATAVPIPTLVARTPAKNVKLYVAMDSAADRINGHGIVFNRSLVHAL